jgi:hypothetical protein
VLLPGSPATYANRAFLKGLGLRWDPEGHRWHGIVGAENVRALREQLGLEVRCFGSLEVVTRVVPTPGSRPITSPAPTVVLARSQSQPRVHDGSRTHLEARIAFPAEGEEQGEIITPTRRFTLAEITSGTPDDSREEDERTEVRRLHDLRGRVKAARAVVSTIPGLTETLQSDWRRAALFYARNGITQEQFRFGIPADATDVTRKG